MERLQRVVGKCKQRKLLLSQCYNCFIYLIKSKMKIV